MLRLFLTILAAVTGSALEWFDFLLFSFFSPVIAQNFFPTTQTHGILWVFMIFSISFLMRPFGGIYLEGWLKNTAGNHLGSFHCFLWVFHLLPIGCLPPFRIAGNFSIIALVLLRLLQGISCGGEFTNAIVYLGEHTKKYLPPFAVFPWMGAFFGTWLGLFVFHLSSIYYVSWRIPFVFGGFIAMLAVLIRIYLNESPAYQKIAKARKNIKTINSALHFLGENKLQLVGVFFLTIQLAVITYMVMIYFPHSLQEPSWNKVAAEQYNSRNILLIILLLPISAILVNFTNKYYLHIITLLLTTTIPFFLFRYIQHNQFVLGSQIIIAFLVALSISTVMSIIFTRFHTQGRALGIGIAYNVALSLFGGTTPVILIALQIHSPSTPNMAIYLAFASIFSFIGFYIMNRMLSVWTYAKR